MALSMRAVEDLYSQIKIYAPNCPPNQMSLQLSRAIKEFLIRTNLWKLKVPIDIVAGTMVYDVSFGEDVFIDDIISVTFGDYDHIDSFELTDDTQLTIDSEFSTEHDGHTMILNAVICPHTFACNIPSRIINRYSEFFVAGALVNICSIPNRLYSNDKIAVMMDNKWQEGLTRASADEASGNKKKAGGFSG